MAKAMTGTSTGWNKTAAPKVSDAELHARIQRKAREIWEKKGCAHGKDLEIWLEAEKLVKSGRD